MDLVQEAARIAESLEYYSVELQSKVLKCDENIKIHTCDLVAASEDGDRSENAAFEEALRDIAKDTQDRMMYNSEATVIEVCQKEAEKYVKRDKIVNYSTVYLVRRYDLEDKHGTNLTTAEVDDEMMFRLYPNGISNPAIGVVSSTDSRVGISLIGKGVGDIITIKHIVTSATAKFEVKDFY